MWRGSFVASRAFPSRLSPRPTPAAYAADPPRRGEGEHIFLKKSVVNRGVLSAQSLPRRLQRRDNTRHRAHDILGHGHAAEDDHRLAVAVAHGGNLGGIDMDLKPRVGG